jgi:hypothetical protein
MNKPNNLSIRTALFVLITCGTLMVSAQTQKAWTGTSKLFGINGTTNPGSTVNWTLVTAGTSSKADSAVSSRNLFTRVTYNNGTAAMIRDTLRVSETVSGCSGSVTNKAVEVYPLPICSLPTSQNICFGGTAANFNVFINNFAAISGIGGLTFNYELRSGSATGSVVSSASGSVTGITSSPVTISTSGWPTLTPGATYYFVITSFGSTNTAGGHPAPGNIASVASFPTTYTILINPAIAVPTITAY